MNLRKLLRTGTLFAVTAALGIGCAKVPDGTGIGDGGRIIEVTMTLRGGIRFDQQRPNYYIFLINRTDNPGDPGPVPVVGVPWGNGFAAASQQDAQGFVGYVVFNAQGGLTGYQVYTAPRDAQGALLIPPDVQAGIPGGWIPNGPPDRSTSPQEGERTLTFQLNLSRLPNPDAQYLQINYLTTNNLPVGVDPEAVKTWDALGNGAETGNLNNWITLDVSQDVLRRNADLNNLEPTGDVRDKLRSLVDDPSLDIEDWSIAIRTQ